MRVTKWGNSLGVRLPKRIVEELDLRAGDELRVVQTIDGTIAIDIGRRVGPRGERPASPRSGGPTRPKPGADESRGDGGFRRRERARQSVRVEN